MVAAPSTNNITANDNASDDALDDTTKEEESPRNENQEEEEIDSSSSSKLEFPLPFYCPITKKVMVEPVVLPDGISYERSALSNEQQEHLKFYPNRALEAVIKEGLELSGTSLRAGMKRMHKSMRDTFDQVLEKSAIPSPEFRPLPDAYYGPITFSLMHDPVLDPEGNTYERAAIENWIRANGSSPLTRTTLTVEELYPNRAIQDLLDLETQRNEGSIHPSIRRFKQEAAPQSIRNSDPESGESQPVGNETNNVEARRTLTQSQRERIEAFQHTFPTNNEAFPTNNEELLQRQRRRKRVKQLTLIGFILAIVVIVLLVIGFPLEILAFLFLFFLVIWYNSCNPSCNCHVYSRYPGSGH